ncbi:MAG: hypothetical protein ABSD47_11890 [Candidatus Methylomirabilota bacterium]|jgi:hypothetical protein
MTKVEQQYRAWRQTPESEVVMGHFRRLAQEAADGHRPCRLKALAERVRDEAGCRLNNIYVAYIGRELVQELPVLQPLVTFRKTAVERDKFPHQWLSQVNAPRRIPTARPWPSGGSCDRQAGR